MKDLKHFVRVAQGAEAAGLVLKNAEVFHAFTGEFIRCDIAIEDGRVAGVGNYTGLREVELAGRYVTPGFLDGHVHIESSMLSPYEFSRAVVPTGTTSVVADPHEIANVAGTRGLEYMMRATEHIPLTVYFMLPSCVPSTELEDSGAVLTAQDLAPFLQRDRVLGLAEMMNAAGVLNGDPAVYDKLAIADSYLVDGHAPGIMGSSLMGYAAAGIRSDHECVTKEQALGRLRAGMHLMLREGSAAKNLRALLPIINADTAQFCFFVTDDRHPADLLSEGHINHMVRLAIEEGLPVATALQMATINTARYFGLQDVGAIAPHYKADLLVFDDLSNWQPSMVFKEGQLVADHGIMLGEGEDVPAAGVEDTVHVSPVDAGDIRIPLALGDANVIGLVPYQILTKKLRISVPVKDGAAQISPEEDLLKLAVFERHHATGRVSAALVKGFGLKHGAIASTIAHDSHNLIVIGASDEDILTAARELERSGGGIVVVDDGKVVGEAALPIAGLMSKLSAREVAETVGRLKALAYEMGVYEYYDPFLTLAFLSLPVIPELKLTDKGLVDVETFQIIPVEAPEAMM